MGVNSCSVRTFHELKGAQSPSGLSPRRGRETPRREVPRGAHRKIPPDCGPQRSPPTQSDITQKSPGGYAPRMRTKTLPGPRAQRPPPQRARIKRTCIPQSASPRARSTAQPAPEPHFGPHSRHITPNTLPTPPEPPTAHAPGRQLPREHEQTRAET